MISPRGLSGAGRDWREAFRDVSTSLDMTDVYCHIITCFLLASS